MLYFSLAFCDSWNLSMWNSYFSSPQNHLINVNFQFHFAKKKKKKNQIVPIWNHIHLHPLFIYINGFISFVAITYRDTMLISLFNCKLCAVYSVKSQLILSHSTFIAELISVSNVNNWIYLEATNLKFIVFFYKFFTKSANVHEFQCTKKIWIKET